MSVKSIILILIVLVIPSLALACGGGQCSCQKSCGNSCSEHQASPLLSEVKAVNKICPVSGRPVQGSGMQAVEYVYNGKGYNLCCGMCIAEFQSNPEKYKNIVEAELAQVK